MITPVIAIIILNHNGGRDTVECLESLSRSNYQNFQIVLVDNGSSDDSLEIIRSWCAQKQIGMTEQEYDKLNVGVTRENHDHRRNNSGGMAFPLLILKAKENLGAAKGRNIGLRYIGNKKYLYIWLLDNDTVADCNALQALILEAQNNQKSGIVGSQLYDYDSPENVQNFSRDNIWLGKSLIPTKLSKNNVLYRQCLKVEWFWGSSLLVKRECLKEIGLFDEQYFFGTEDRDLCIRALKKGWEIVRGYGSRVWHKWGAKKNLRKKSHIFGRYSYRERSFRSGYYGLRGEIYFVKKNFSKYQLFYCCNYLLLRIIRQIIGIILFDTNKIARVNLTLKAVYHAFLNKMGKHEHPLLG